MTRDLVYDPNILDAIGLEMLEAVGNEDQAIILKWLQCLESLPHHFFTEEDKEEGVLGFGEQIYLDYVSICRAFKWLSLTETKYHVLMLGRNEWIQVMHCPEDRGFHFKVNPVKIAQIK